jgi:RNA methyltransferase, TrmH family
MRHRNHASIPLTFDDICSLKEQQTRARTGLFFFDGLRFLHAAIAAKANIRQLVICPQLLRGRDIGFLKSIHAPILELTPPQFRELSLAPEPQGVGAVADLLWQPLETQKVNKTSCWIGIEHIRNPGNLGTILRTCDAVRANTVVVFDRSDEGSPSGVDPHDPAVVRASMGGLFSVRLVRTTHSQFRKWQRRYELTVIGATPEAEIDYRRLTYRRPVMLMLGSERKGLSPGQEGTCESFVKIPMAGQCTSLNLAMAATVLLYEVHSQRHPVRR